MALNETPIPFADCWATWWVSPTTTKDAGRPSEVAATANFVYVGGHFDRVHTVSDTNQTRNHLYRNDRATGELDSWDPNCLPAGDGGGRVWDIAVDPTGQYVAVVGDFTTIAGSSRDGIAIFEDATGNLIASFAGWTQNGSIRGVAWDSTGRLYLSGTFTSFNGTTCQRIVRITNPLTSPSVDGSWLPTTSKTIKHIETGLVSGGGEYVFVAVDASSGTINGNSCHIAAINTTGDGTSNVWRGLWDQNIIDMKVNDDLQLVVGGHSGPGGDLTVYDYAATGLQTENYYYHANGDVQGVGFIKGTFAETFIVGVHHDNACAAVKNSDSTTESAVGLFIIDANGILQSAPWRNQLVQNSSVPGQDGGGYLKGFGVNGIEDPNDPILFVHGDFTRTKGFSGSPSTLARRVAGFRFDDAAGGGGAPDPPPAAGSGTLGKDTIGLSNANGAADRLRLSQWVAPEDVGDLLSIAAYMDRTTTGTQSGFLVRGVVYTDNSGAPGTLKAEVELTGGLGVELTNPQWYEVTFPTPITGISPGATYWVGVHMSKAIQNYYDSGLTNDGIQGTDEYDDGAPNPWSVTSEAYQTRQYSVYATYGQEPKAVLSFVEFETPDPPSRGRVSFVEMETPDDNRFGAISYVELETPSLAVESFTVRLSQLRDGTRLRQGNTEAVTRAGQFDAVEFEIQDFPVRATFDALELEIPDVQGPAPIPGTAVASVEKRMRARGRVRTT